MTSDGRRQRIASGLVLIALMGCSTLAPLGKTTHSNGLTMPNAVEAAQDPALSPRALMERTLAYLAGLKHPEDASLERFAAVMGAMVERARDGDYAEIVVSYPSTGWMLTVRASERGSPLLEFQVAHDHLNNDTLDVDMGPVCEMDLQQVQTALADMGFQQGPALPGESGYEKYGALVQPFTRGALSVELLAQRENSASSGLGRMCVRRLEADLVKPETRNR